MKTHGMYYTPVHRIWRQIHRRCYEKNHISYPRYGGAGVAVCDRWMTFENFYADMGDMPEGHQIDRIDNSKGYSPENCRWATLIDQANNKRNNQRVEWGGRVETIANWARELNLKRCTLRDRILRYGWSVERAFREPSRGWSPGNPRKE